MRSCNRCAPLIGQGKVADYIPALAEVAADRLAIAVCTVDGEMFQAGNADERFSIQSISKVLSLTLALTRYQEAEIWRRVGKEPSGLPFNSAAAAGDGAGQTAQSVYQPRCAGGVRHAANPAQRASSSECWKWCVNWPVKMTWPMICGWPVPARTLRSQCGDSLPDEVVRQFRKRRVYRAANLFPLLRAANEL